MNRQNRGTRSLGRAGAAACLVFLAASLALAISPDERSHRRRQSLQEAQLRAMDAFALAYGGADWSAVWTAVAEHTGGAENPRIMSVFLSFGNVFLNRFEHHHSAEDLDRALMSFEAVAQRANLWGRRPFAGSVVVYLGIAIVRLGAECDVGPYGARIEELRRRVGEVAAQEADAVVDLEEYIGWLAITSPEEDAARAALYATAANLLPEDARAPNWGEHARTLAERLSTVVSPSAETLLNLSQAELLYEASGGEVPRAFGPFGVSRAAAVAFRAPLPESAGSSRIAPIFEPVDLLEAAVEDSRAMAAILSDYLRLFPPGTQCAVEEESAGSAR